MILDWLTRKPAAPHANAWVANRVQARRIEALLGWFERHVPVLWGFDVDPHSIRYRRLRYAHPSFRDDDQLERYRTTLECLEHEFEAEPLLEGLADVLLYPGAWTQARLNFTDERRETLEAVTCAVAARRSLTGPTTYFVDRLAARIAHMVRHAKEGIEPPAILAPPDDGAEAYLSPKLEWCLRMLTEVREHPAALPRIEALLLDTSRGPIPTDYHPQLWKVLQEAGRFDYARYATSVTIDPGALHTQPEWLTDTTTRPHAWPQRYLWSRALVLEDADLTVLSTAFVDGARFVIRGCEIVEARDLTSLSDWNDPWQAVARHMIGAFSLEDGDDLGGLARDLRRFTPATLRLALPRAHAAEAAFFEALGWTQLLPLRRVLTDLCRSGVGHGAFSNSPDSTRGIIDVDGVRAAVDGVDSALARELLDMYGQSDRDSATAIMLIEAVFGWNRDRVERGLKKQSQPAMKALGLLPLTRGLDEIAERVDALQACIPAAERYGPERRANTRAAVAAGLANLARTAGFADATQLEWAVLAHRGPGELASPPSLTTADYRVELVFEHAPVIAVWKGRRRLAKVPAAVRTLDGFAELRTAHAAAREQHERYAASLERLMVDGRALDAALLERLMAWPVVRALAERLVWADGAGRLGLYDSDHGTLVSPDDAVTAAGALRVVHPVELPPPAIEAWRTHLAERGLEQPFPQLAREVYRLTERERTLQESDRYAGALVHTKQVGRLIDDRDWAWDDDMGLTRGFAAGLWATFDLCDARRFLTESETSSTGAVAFRRRVLYGSGDAVPLAEVPAVVVSEAFRDVDLMVSAAAAASYARDDTPAQVIAQRVALLQAIVGPAGLTNVRLTGRYAHVVGTRAQYRVHLGSGVIHVEAAGTLVVRAEPVQPIAAPLPFADGDDAKAPEIVAKVLLLADDAAIDDPALLAQLPAGGAGVAMH